MILDRSMRRRGLLQGAAATAGVSALGVLSGCGKQAAAVPAKGPAPTVITFAPWGQWTAVGSDWEKFIQPAMDYFQSLPANKGIQIQVVAPGGAGRFASAIAGGSGPDVFEDWLLSPYLNPDLVLNLDKYMQQDGISANLWSPGQMHAMTLDSGTYFLPCYVDCSVLAVNLSNLDAMGLPYPDPEWDYTAAMQAYKAATVTMGGKKYVGLSSMYNGTFMALATTVTRAYAMHIFGGSVMDDTRLICTMDSPKTIEAIQWWDTLYWDGIAGGGTLTNGVTYQEIGSNSILTSFETWGNSFKWTFFPVPKYPNGRISFSSTDYYAINAGTKHPEQAWLFLKFLAAQPYWSRYTMKYLLRPPSLVSVWDEFPSVVEQVTPLAKTVGIQYFVESAQKWAIAGRDFTYDQGQAMTILNQALTTAMGNKGQDPTTVMTAAAQAVNALEQQAAATAAKASGTAASGSSSSSTSSSSSSNASKA